MLTETTSPADIWARERVEASARPGRHLWHQLGLVTLLLGELLFLTVAFDTQPLDTNQSLWAWLIGSSPQLLRLAIAIVVLTGLIGGSRIVRAVLTPGTTTSGAPFVRALIVHIAGFAGFAFVTPIVFAGGNRMATNPGTWALVWGVLGTATFVAWALALYPLRRWVDGLRHYRLVVAAGVAAGSAVWVSGFVTEALWKPLARYTFAVVTWLLGGLYSDVVSRPDSLVVGTTVFKVEIAPTCSGYEGVGLILAFLGIYFYLFRRELRFPAALVLLPIGAVTIWTLNAVRVVALIVIGTSGWREIALGGFHSQAGWIAFNAVGLTFVALIHRGGYFMRQAPPVTHLGAERADSTTAYLGPFVAMLAATMLTGAFSAGFNWLYPVCIGAAVAVLWSCRRAYTELQWRPSPAALGIGAVTFVVWMALLPEGLASKDGWPSALSAVPYPWAAGWLAVRLAGYVLVAPIVEELAFRVYAMRRVISANVDEVPVGYFTWPSLIVSSAVFGAFHGRLWVPGIIAGLLFAGALYRRRAFGDAVVAHATTNGLIALYVFATGRWSVWS